MPRTLILPAAALGLLLFVPAAAPAQYDRLDLAFKEKAPAVIEYAKKRGYDNIGVLKFLVAVGDARATDDVGELNMGLADRLELALILANHRDPDGRRAFFQGPYEMAWGTETVKPGGFITGTATLSKDLTQITIKLQAFGPDGALADLPGGTITAPTTARILTESGRSFYLNPAEYRKVLDGSRGVKKENRSDPVVAEQLEQHKAILEQQQKEPQKSARVPALTEGPVKLTIFVNGNPTEVIDGRAPEPKAGDKLGFELFNRSPDTCAVVLKVNGESTLGRGRGDPFFNQKWVLTPGEKVRIEGFFVEADKIEPFRILPPEESDALSVRYGDNAGTFRMTVWRGAILDKPGEQDVDAELSDEELSLMVIARGAGPKTDAKPQTLRALQALLRRPDRDAGGSRGLVVAGSKQGGGETQWVRFKPESSIPVAEAVIRYYEPKKPAHGPKVSK
jgi:hypothetical protein